MEPTTSPHQSPRSRMRLTFILMAVVVSAIAFSIYRQDRDPSETLIEPASTDSPTDSRADVVPDIGVPDIGHSTAVTTEADDQPGNAPAPSDKRSTPAPTSESPGESDKALATRMLGTWEDDYKGHRTLTLLEDGNGTMVVELDGFASTLFAAKLTFTEQWSVKDGHVTMKATGGEPEGKVRLVLNLHGDTSTQEIIEVTEDRMILVEKPSGTRFEWRRVAETDVADADAESKTE